MEDVKPLGPEEQFMSRLNSLPLDLECEVGEIPLQKGMRPTSRKEKVIELLNKYHVDFVEIGTGTNRFIVKYDSYVIKIALDHEGVADNIQEFAICESLMPHVAYAHEISEGGHLLVADYCPAFTTHGEMFSHHSEIKKILTEWSQRYLLGDVGLTQHNYANWGLAPGGRPVCIDYAYIFPASLNIFKCICGNGAMTFAKGDFSTYKCTKCGKTYEDRELRAKISPEERRRLFNNVQGIKMTQEFEMHPVDPKYIKYNPKPDEPDVYETAMNAAMHFEGHQTSNWY